MRTGRNLYTHGISGLKTGSCISLYRSGVFFPAQRVQLQSNAGSRAGRILQPMAALWDGGINGRLPVFSMLRPVQGKYAPRRPCGRQWRRPFPCLIKCLPAADHMPYNFPYNEKKRRQLHSLYHVMKSRRITLRGRGYVGKGQRNLVEIFF